jgi:TM2 domain-containing membrane protein YozV
VYVHTEKGRIQKEEEKATLMTNKHKLVAGKTRVFLLLLSFCFVGGAHHTYTSGLSLLRGTIILLAACLSTSAFFLKKKQLWLWS